MSDKLNIFQIWKDNDEKLPFKVCIDSWSDKLGHYALIEKVEVTKWPYGRAYGQYYFYGKPGEKGLVKNSGTYRWKLVE